MMLGRAEGVRTGTEGGRMEGRNYVDGDMRLDLILLLLCAAPNPHHSRIIDFSNFIYTSMNKSMPG